MPNGLFAPLSVGTIDAMWWSFTMMRRNAWLLPIVILAATLVLPPAGQAAGGSALRFGQDRYSAGEHAVAHARVETWKGSSQPEDGPYTVYLVRGRHSLWFGHLPRQAINVGELRIGRLVARDTYRVTVAFEVPRVPEGPYAVWVCGARSGGTGCWLGFGDLVYGQIVVTHSIESTDRARAATFSVEHAFTRQREVLRRGR